MCALVHNDSVCCKKGIMIMTISEKSAYLKGLMDGLSLNTETDEGKMIAAIVDLLGDMAKRVTDIEETTIYEVTCACGEVIAFDEETLEEGSIICENCGEKLEFSFDDEDEEELEF